jgi:hypothetical protein
MMYVLAPAARVTCVVLRVLWAYPATHATPHTTMAREAGVDEVK